MSTFNFCNFNFGNFKVWQPSIMETFNFKTFSFDNFQFRLFSSKFFEWVPRRITTTTTYQLYGSCDQKLYLEKSSFYEELVIPMLFLSSSISIFTTNIFFIFFGETFCISLWMYLWLLNQSKDYFHIKFLTMFTSLLW